MHGSTLSAMADGIESSDVVLLCVSQAYKDSCNCRAEAEYAFTLKKPIIPLLVEADYRPDGMSATPACTRNASHRLLLLLRQIGWLGLVQGAKLYLDFADEGNFDKTLPSLLKEIAACAKGSTINLLPSRSAVDPSVLSAALQFDKFPEGIEEEEQEQELVVYKELLDMAMADGIADAHEQKQLEAARQKYGISNQQHEQLVAEAGYDIEDVVSEGIDLDALSAMLQLPQTL
jgi:hypothetical protein